MPIEPAQLRIAEQAILAMAEMGSHKENPYHNTNHCKNVLDACKKILLHDNAPLTLEIIWAALFHDYDHSGGIRDDRHNIKVAIAGVDHYYDNPTKQYKTIAKQVGQFDVDEVIDIILCTKYLDGKFMYEPDTYHQKVIRDADLMSIYLPTEEAAIALNGLRDELSYKMPKLNSKSFIEKNNKFLNDAIWYTAYGNLLKETQLEQALIDIEPFL